MLIECLVRRMGHTIATGDSLRDIDVVFYEPQSIAGLALARRAQERCPGVRLVAMTAAPPREPLTSPRPFASLLQPFAPRDLRRVLEAALMGSVRASPST